MLGIVGSTYRVVGGLKSITKASGTNVFGTLDQVKWPLPQKRKRVTVNQSTGNSESYYENFRPAEIKELRMVPRQSMNSASL